VVALDSGGAIRDSRGGVTSHQAERTRELRPFLAMEVMERAVELEAAGAKVLHLGLGEPDAPPPPAAVAAASRALAEGRTRYTDSRGLRALREAIAADKERRTGVPVDPDRVLVTSGTSPAMLVVFSLLVEPGDEVILGAPYYPCYPNFVRLCGGVPVAVPADPGDGFALRAERVKAAIGPRTRAIVVASPANPTGAVQDLASLVALAELGLPIVSDEIYDGLVYAGAHAPSSLETGARDVFVLDGFSKRYAMTGFRLGYVIAPSAEAARTLQVLCQNFFLSAAEFVQYAGIAALREGEATVRAMRERYARQRDRMLAGLAELGLRVAVPPAGAFYVLADARHVDRDSRRLAFRLLEEAHVAVTPGIDFGDAAEGYLRFCYAVSDATLDGALARMRTVLAP
jgi:aspartate/methionine/tyrosine aminotransferase